MNTILQKRIESAAEKYAYTNWENDDYHEGAEEGMPFDPIGYLEKCFKKAAAFALQNQWISVGEELPKKIEDKDYSKYVLVRQEYYQHECFVIARYDYNFKMWVSTFYFEPKFITHWMPIPSLERGEE